MSGIEEVLQAVLGTDNAERKQAEETLEASKSSDPSKLMEQLYTCMSHSQDNVCNLACVLFRKYFLDTDLATTETLKTIEQNMFGILDFSRSKLVLHGQGSVIVRVYVKLEDYQTLLQKIIELNQNSENAVRELAMFMLEILVDVHIPVELAKQSIDDFKALFKQGLEDSDLDVKVASLKATSSFITSLDDTDLALKMTDLMSLVLDTMIEALKSNEDAGKSSLESMIDIAEFHPDIFKEYGSNLVTVISQIMTNSEFEDSTRSSAKEILLSLAHKAPGMVRKIENIKSDFYPALFQMMTEVQNEDDLEEWNKEDEEEDVTRTDPHGVAREALVRFARIIGETITMEASSDLIKTNMQSEDWKYRQAAYFYLGYLSDSCKKIFSQNLDETIRMAAAGVSDSHPRVQFAGLTCLAMMLSEQAPKAQKMFHAEIMPELLRIMNSDSLLKIKTQATSATVNFVRELIQVDVNEIEDTQKEDNVIEAYTDDILETCSTLFTLAIEQSNPALQEEVLALISCVAALIEKKFAKYYSNFMPGLQQIILNTPNETRQQQDLRSNTIQTIGFLCDAIKDDEENREQFKEDAKAVVEIFKSILSSDKVKEEDHEVTCITNALTQVASVLKEDFAPFLPEFMEKLLRDSQIEVDFKLEDAELPNAGQDENLTSVVFKMKGLDGEKKLSLNTFALEAKINATQVIRALAQNLGTTFQPFVQETFEKLSPLFDYKYSRAVRTSSIECCQYLILAIENVEDRKKLMTGLTNVFATSLESLIKKKDSVEIVSFLKEYYHCIKIFKEPSPVTSDQAELIIKLCADSCVLASEDKQLTIEEIEKQRHHIDEEDLEGYKEELDEIEKIFMYTMEITGQFMRIYREAVTEPIKTHLLTIFAQNMTKSENTEHEIIDSLCFLIDCCEFLSMDLFNQIYEDVISKFFDIYEKYRENEDRDLVQSVCFGFGVIAQRLPSDKFQRYFEKAHAVLEETINVPDALDEDFRYATENALSSLLKFVYYHKDGNVITDSSVQKYLGMLPLEEDLDEALAVNKELINQVDARNSNLFGANNCNATFIQNALNRIAKFHHDDPSLETLNEEYEAKLNALLS